MTRFLKARAATRGSAPKKFDECVYTPFSYTHEQPRAISPQASEDLISLHSGPILEVGEGDSDDRSLYNFVAQQNQAILTSDVFLFQYGVVVIWGMSLEDERHLLRDISKFETEKLSDDDIQVENFNFYVTSSYQPRIYNDFITLKDGKHYMVKLSISHAIAQSVKVCDS